MYRGSSSLRSRQRTLVALPCYGGLAQLARAPALQAGGQRFESVILHFAPHVAHEIFDMLDKQDCSGVYRLYGVDTPRRVE